VVGDGFIFVERDFPLLRKNCSNLHIIFGILCLQKTCSLLGFVFYCYYFIDKLPCFLYHDCILGKLVYNNFVWRFLLSG